MVHRRILHYLCRGRLFLFIPVQQAPAQIDGLGDESRWAALNSVFPPAPKTLTDILLLPDGSVWAGTSDGGTSFSEIFPVEA